MPQQQQQINVTKDQLLLLGFSLVKSYDHDQFHTDRYEKGCMQVELTYDNSALVSCDVSFRDDNYTQVNYEQLKALAAIF